MVDVFLAWLISVGFESEGTSTNTGQVPVLEDEDHDSSGNGSSTTDCDHHLGFFTDKTTSARCASISCTTSPMSFAGPSSVLI